MQTISTRMHGMIDYATAAVLILIPLFYILGGATGAVVWIPLIAGLALLGMSLVTRYELGVIRWIPMRTHLLADMLLGAFLIVSPWLFGFADVVWWPHVLVGIAEIAVAAMTKRQPSLPAARGEPAAAAGPPR